MSRLTPHVGPDGGLSRGLRSFEQRLSALEARVQGPRLFGPYTTAPVAIAAGTPVIVSAVHNLDLPADSYEVLGLLQSDGVIGVTWHLKGRQANDVTFQVVGGSGSTSVSLRFYVAVGAPGELSF